jgi:translation initiation factor 3 subunit K
MTATPLIQSNVTMSRPEEVEAILNGIELFNPDNLPRLEHYFGVQCRKNEYDQLANLAILELYQFNPQLVNPSIIVSILAKALTVLPGPDFNTYSCLLTQKTVS